MTLYEIDNAITELLDPETGEILDMDAFCELSIARDDKIEGAALLLKNNMAKAAAIKDEIDALTARKKVAENTVKRLKEYLAMALNGERFETAKCSISYRKSEKVDTEDGVIPWVRGHAPDLLKEQEPNIDLVGLKMLLKSGVACPFARVTTSQNIQVK